MDRSSVAPTADCPLPRYSLLPIRYSLSPFATRHSLMTSQPLRVGVAGLGTVGVSVVRIPAKQKRFGQRLEHKKLCRYNDPSRATERCTSPCSDSL